MNLADSSGLHRRRQRGPIENYEFGNIVVAGRAYSRDILILPDGTVIPDWWRKEGHSLCLEDLAPVIEKRPELLVVGTGAYGVLRPDPALEKHLAAAQIRLTTAPTPEAVIIFNREFDRRRTAGAFHLTC